jgi:hypothetical protein
MKIEVKQQFFGGNSDEIKKYGGVLPEDDNDTIVDKNIIYRGTIMDVGRMRAEELISRGLAVEYKEKSKSWF